MKELTVLSSLEGVDLNGVINRTLCKESKGIVSRDSRISGVIGFVRNQLDMRLYERLIDPSAKIHPTAKLGNRVKIGANSVIRAYAVLNDEVEVGPNCLVGERSVIGAGTVLQENVFIDHDVQIGDNCVFGDDFESHSNPAYHYDHQLKIVMTGTQIGHNSFLLGKVFVGRDCVIKLATIGERTGATIIGDGCRFSFDVFARGLIPPGTELLNCASMVGKADGTTIHSSDWWVTSGMFSDDDESSLEQT